MCLILGKILPEICKQRVWVALFNWSVANQRFYFAQLDRVFSIRFGTDICFSKVFRKLVGSVVYFVYPDLHKTVLHTPREMNIPACFFKNAVSDAAAFCICFIGFIVRSVFGNGNMKTIRLYFLKSVPIMMSAVPSVFIPFIQFLS